MFQTVISNPSCHEQPRIFFLMFLFASSATFLSKVKIVLLPVIQEVKAKNDTQKITKTSKNCHIF